MCEVSWKYPKNLPNIYRSFKTNLFFGVKWSKWIWQMHVLEERGCTQYLRDILLGVKRLHVHLRYNLFWSKRVAVSIFFYLTVCFWLGIHVNRDQVVRPSHSLIRWNNTGNVDNFFTLPPRECLHGGGIARSFPTASLNRKKAQISLCLWRFCCWWWCCSSSSSVVVVVIVVAVVVVVVFVVVLFCLFICFCCFFVFCCCFFFFLFVCCCFFCFCFVFLLLFFVFYCCWFLILFVVFVCCSFCWWWRWYCCLWLWWWWCLWWWWWWWFRYQSPSIPQRGNFSYERCDIVGNPLPSRLMWYDSVPNSKEIVMLLFLSHPEIGFLWKYWTNQKRK